MGGGGGALANISEWKGAEGVVGFKAQSGFKVNNAAVFTQMPSGVRANEWLVRQVGADGYRGEVIR